MMLLKVPKLTNMLFRAAALALLQSCSTAIPKGIKPVADFDINQYLGCWYEIARLDHDALNA